MFFCCEKLPTVDVSHWDTGKVEGMSFLFHKCYNLQTVDLSNWDTSSLLYMTHAFHRCNSLTTLDLSNWDVSNVLNMNYMFQHCYNLELLNVRNWNLNEYVDTTESWIFAQNPKLTTIIADNCNTITINALIHQIYNRNTENKYGKLYALNNKEHDLINKATADDKNWKVVIRSGNIQSVSLPEKLLQSLGLGNNIMVKHIHIGERFL
jgi:surface protein